MVDVTVLLINAIWAVVVLTGVGAACHVLRRLGLKDALAEEVMQLRGNLADVRHRLNLTETEHKEAEERLLKVAKDTADIRAGLEKLKAIPPKPVRY